MERVNPRIGSRGLSRMVRSQRVCLFAIAAITGFVVTRIIFSWVHMRITWQIRFQKEGKRVAKGMESDFIPKVPPEVMPMACASMHLSFQWLWLKRSGVSERRDTNTRNSHRN